MQFLKLKKTGKMLMMNVMITGAFFSITSCCSCCSSLSEEPFWLIRINKDSFIANSEDPDSYGYKIVPRQRTKKGIFGKIVWQQKLHYL